MNPRYPIYIVSKGRWESRLTAKNLEEASIPYYIVVEPQELDQYKDVIDRKKILVLPFSNLGQGSIPARNWAWEHSITNGHERHWILDDNIDGFYRFNRNLKVKVSNGSTFAAIEDFTDRYENVPMSGMNYFMFVTRKAGNIPPVYFNTRIYSCILLSNSILHRWRGWCNEDTDLSIQILKSGYCTILFNAFLALKQTTMSMKGGNTDGMYSQQLDDRLEITRSLQHQHPDIVRIVRKWGRWQHQVDYSKFKANKLIRRKDFNVTKGVDNYGMRLLKVEPKGKLQG